MSSRDLVSYLRESANRLLGIAAERPDMAAKLRSLAASMESKAAEIEAMLRDGREEE